MKAACDVVLKNATYPGAIGAMIEPILPAALAARAEPGDYVTNAAKLSAQRTAARLTSASALLSGLAGEGKLKIASAIYDLESGVVTVSRLTGRGGPRKEEATHASSGEGPTDPREALCAKPFV